MYLQGFGCTVISRILNEDEIPAPAKYKKEILQSGYAWDTGKGLWTSSSVQAILKNPVYTGAIVLRKMNKPSYKLQHRKRIPLEEQELIRDAHEAIISNEDFEQVQLIRKKNYVPYFDKNKEPHKYVGLLFCGKCKTVMRKHYLASHNSYDGYMCGFHQKMGKNYCEQNHITFEKLDELVIFAINQQLKHRKKEIKELKSQIALQKPEIEGEIIRLDTKIARNTEYRKKAYEQFMDDILSKEEYLELKQMYDAENEKYQKEVQELKIMEKEQQDAIRDAVMWVESFGQKKMNAKHLTRDVLVELIDRIYVYPDQKIDIYFKFNA
jgi:hypothetical protein